MKSQVNIFNILKFDFYLCLFRVFCKVRSSNEWNNRQILSSLRSNHFIEALIMGDLNRVDSRSPATCFIQQEGGYKRSLPNDVLRLIFAYLDPCSLLSLRNTCRLFRKLVIFKFEHEHPNFFEGLGFCETAAKLGYLSLLKWARNKGAPLESWNTEPCTSAARGGHLAMLQWLRTQGAPWDGRACASAADHQKIVLDLFVGLAK